MTNATTRTIRRASTARSRRPSAGSASDRTAGGRRRERPPPPQPREELRGLGDPVRAPGQAWVRRMPCSSPTEAETSRWNPAGESPARQGWPTSRKRVLRGARVTAAAKRRQRACRPWDGAPKLPCRGGRRFVHGGRQHGRVAAETVRRPQARRCRATGVRGQGMHARVLQEPGRSRRLHQEVELPSGAQASGAGAPGSRSAS